MPNFTLVDFVLIAAIAYAVAPLSLFAIRAWGFLGRSLARAAIKRAATEINRSFVAGETRLNNLSDDQRLERAAKTILKDHRITKNELLQFTELTIASYVLNGASSLELLQRANRDRDPEVRALFYLSKRLLEDGDLLAGLSSEVISRAQIRNILFRTVEGIAARRISRFGVELAEKISVELPTQPVRVAQFAEPGMLERFALSGIPTSAKR